MMNQKKIMLAIAIFGVFEVLLSSAAPWGTDSHENFHGHIETFKFPLLTKAVIPLVRSTAFVSAPAAAPAAPAPAPAVVPAVRKTVPARSIGVSHVGFAFGGGDSREFGYGGGFDGSNEVGFVALPSNKQQIW